MAAETHKSDKKLKFLFLSSDKFPPFRVDVAVLFGVEMVKRGHTIDWLLQSEAQCNAAYQTHWSGGRVWVAPADNGASRVRRLKKNLFSLRNDMRMFSVIRRNKYDFVQVKDKFIAALMAIVAAKLYGTKFIYWLSYPFPEDSLLAAKEGTARYPAFYFIRGWIFKVLLYRVILPSATHVFVQSEQMLRDVAKEGIPPKKMTAVPMGVALEKIPYNADSNRATGPHEKKILYLGTLNRLRKIDFLLRVFKKVLKQESSVRLYLVGGGDDPKDEELLRKEVIRLGIEDFVNFTGFIPMTDAWRYIAEADVCVSPFYPTPILNSTSPTKLIEYMAMGKAVVANDHPEQRLVISKSGAGICVPYEEDAFVQAIVTLLNDPSLCQEMGVKGRRYVEEYRSYGRIADMIEAQYLRVLT